MDIKAQIEEIISKVKNDKDFSKSFKDDPVKTVEKTVGVDLPDAQINAIIEGVKAKVDLDKLGGLGGIVSKLTGNK